jgi:hypothetical protein
MKHSTSKIKLMELAGLVKEVAVTDQKVANVRKAMEAAIALLNNPKEIERRINNIKFAVYNSLDPNTNGGERPKPGFKFDDAWWASAVTDDYALSLVGSEIKGALAGKSFGEPLIKEGYITNDMGEVEITFSGTDKFMDQVAVNVFKKYGIDQSKLNREYDANEGMVEFTVSLEDTLVDKIGKELEAADRGKGEYGGYY